MGPMPPKFPMIERVLKKKRDRVQLKRNTFPMIPAPHNHGVHHMISTGGQKAWLKKSDTAATKFVRCPERGGPINLLFSRRNLHGSAVS